jgi:hypothetical protein
LPAKTLKTEYVKINAKFTVRAALGKKMGSTQTVPLQVSDFQHYRPCWRPRQQEAVE